MRKQTPWGQADFSTELSEGIISYSTPSHGGIWLSASRRKVVEAVIPGIKNFLGGLEWWEEDCDWAIPYVTFQDDIRLTGKAYKFEENLETAKSIISRYHPEAANILS
jgi:hypothetical protein